MVPAGPPSQETPLAQFPFARALAELWQLKKSGVVRVTLRSLRKVVVVANGSPVFVDSNIAEESLGAYLVRRGAMGQKQVYAAQSKAAASGRQLGDILIDKGMLTPDALLVALRRCFGARILSAFHWTEGHLAFDANQPDLHQEVNLRMSPAMLVLRGVAVYAPLESVEAHFAAGLLDKYQLRPGAAEHAGDLGLNITEERVFQLLNEPRTVDGVAHEAGVTIEFITRFLYALSLLGIVAGPEEVARGTLSPAPHRIVADEPALGKPLTAAEASGIDAEYLACRSQDHFAWLGVPRDASDETLKRAFLSRSESFSPGAFKGRDLGEHRERFESIYLTLAQAYCTLSDPARCASYVAELERRVEERRQVKTESAEVGRYFDADTLLGTGMRLAESGQHADALRFFQEILDDQPHHFGALVRLGHSIYMSAPDEFMRAVRHLQEAMAMEPDSGEPYFYLGLIYEARGDPESARHAFAECERRNSGHEGARAGLGRIAGEAE